MINSPRRLFSECAQTSFLSFSVSLSLVKMTHTHHWCDSRYRASSTDNYKLCTIYFLVLRHVTIRNPRTSEDIDARFLHKALSIIPILVERIVFSITSLIFPIARSYNYLVTPVVSDEKRTLERKKETVSIEILYAQFPSLAKPTAFENLSQGWIPAANSQQLKRDIGSRRRAQIFTGFTQLTLYVKAIQEKS